MSDLRSPAVSQRVEPASPPAAAERPRIQGGSWVYDPDLECMVPKGGRNYFDRNEKRSDLAFPNVIAGTMPTIKSMADGKYYDCKRTYEKSVHRKGCEIVGFDKNWESHVKPPQPYGGEKAHEADIVADVKKAIEIETSKLPSYGPAARRRARQQRRKARETIA